jgi:hypothetical protein
MNQGAISATARRAAPDHVFLPAILLLPSLLFSRGRRALMAGWRTWSGAALLAVALIAPWFIYAYVIFGQQLWEVMLGKHVYTRFATGLIAEHVNPWHFYFSTMWNRFAFSQVEWLVAAGAVTLVVQTILRRWLEGAIVIGWALLTLVPISFGSSKLYHYAYPFLPPIALGAGYLAALVMMLVPVQIRKIGAWLEDAIASIPAFARLEQTRLVRVLAGAVFWSAALLAVGALLFGTIRLQIGHTLLLRSSGVSRPLIMMAIAALLTRRSIHAATLVTALALASFLPIVPYKTMWELMEQQKHPIRDTSQCVQRVQRDLLAQGNVRPGVGVDTESLMWHTVNFYFRRVRPMQPVVPLTDQVIDDALGASPWPLLMSNVRYRQYREHLATIQAANVPSPPVAEYLDYVVVLPGPYRQCSPESRLLR